MISIVTGNIITVTFAFNLIKKKKTPDYIFAVYMLLTQLFIIAISGLNVFKPYVADTFLVAMGVLIGIAIFYLVTLILVAKYVEDETTERWMIFIAISSFVDSFNGESFCNVTRH